jgi:hypothetical protein
MNELIDNEFNYAKDTSLQSQQDRLTLLNFYLVLYAAGVTIALGGNNALLPGIASSMHLLLFGLTLISFIFVLKIVRLRQSWVESVIVMNKLKEYYLQARPELENFLLWKTKTIPAAHRLNTISFFSALLISILGSTSLGLGISLVTNSLVGAIIGSLVYLILSVATYYLLLKYNR